MSYTIGLDFGSDSVRALIVHTQNGEEVGTAVSYYTQWMKSKYCNPNKNRFRQHPQDYLDALTAVIHESLEQAGDAVRKQIVAIGVDTTGSTPCPVDASGTPLAMLPAFGENPNAMFHLWKDHTAIKEAAEINEANAKSPKDYLKYVGGIYSSEWYWAKILHTYRMDTSVKEAAHSWVEHCDWIPFLLTGGKDVSQLKRSICASGHKALWHAEFNGVPADFLSNLDPLLKDFNYKLLSNVYPADEPAGKLSTEWAEKLKLSQDVVVAVGAYDAHMGAVGGEIEAGYLSKVIGTSTCDIMVAPLQEEENLVKGICGQVNGSVIPGMLGLEAGQSAFGDVYAWFKNLISWPLGLLNDEALKVQVQEQIIAQLTEEAEKLPVTTNDMVALDWMNGRRTPDANQNLKGVLSGINLGSDAPRVFKSLVEATCFGARAIVERFLKEGVDVKGVIALGGVAKKSAYVMQTLSHVLNRPIKVGKSEQTCALGAAMFGATAAGIFPNVDRAMKSMGGGFDRTYHPDPDIAKIYDQLYQKYLTLGEFTETSIKNEQL